MSYLPIIGLEIHVELNTQSKMFCGCPADHFNKKPNTQTCPVCLGLPGALPVPNEKAILWTQLIGLSLNCTLAAVSKFDRKHYFYPDLAKGYQISQYDEPLCTNGHLGPIQITRVHLEEDTGKLQHKHIGGKAVSLVDFNRSGVALVEIVSEPQLHSASEAKNYAQEIRKIISFLGVSDCDMEKGSMRLEANISLSTLYPGSKSNQDLGSFILPPYKVEVKNINSFRFLERAIDYEIIRQTKLLDQGIIPDQETRGFNEAKMITVPQRSKEEAKDYRYFPEPDIPPMEFTQEYLDALKNQLPKLPAQFQSEFIKLYGVRPDYAASLVEHRQLAEKAQDCFVLAVKNKLLPAQVANLIINKKSSTMNLTPIQIIALAKKLTSPATSVNLNKLVASVLEANPNLVAKYHQGKLSVVGALIGFAMKESRGQADAGKLNHLFLAALKEGA